MTADEEEEGQTEDDMDDAVQDPSYQETVTVIRKLKNHKAAEKDGITAELIKAAGKPMWKRIHQLILKIWTEERILDYWKVGVIHPIY